MREFEFRIWERESAMGGALYIPEYREVKKGWRDWFSGWKEVLKPGYDGPRELFDITTAGPRYCCSYERALAEISAFKKRGFKNPPSVRGRITYVE